MSLVLMRAAYFAVLIVVGTVLCFFFGWITYCDPLDDLKELFKELLKKIRKRSWEK